MAISVSKKLALVPTTHHFKFLLFQTERAELELKHAKVLLNESFQISAAILSSKSLICSVKEHKEEMKNGYHSSQVIGCLLIECLKKFFQKLIGQSVMLWTARIA